MVFRKPYAFLIKNFKKIHIVLFVLAVYIYFKQMSLYGFLNNYVSMQSYNANLESIDKYVGGLTYLAIFAIIAITALLIYLLLYKKKPWKLYLVILFEYILLFVGFFMASRYFHSYDADSALSSAMAIRDTIFIGSFPQYAVFVILFIRIAGIDLSKFDFSHDEEFLELSAEDREEFEINIDVDKESFKRGFKKFKRNLYYLYQEHKFIMNVLAIFLVLIVGALSYYNIFILNKVYKQGETLNAIGYSIKINKAYFTNLNYAGEVIESSNFVVLDLDVKNNEAPRKMNVERFHVMNKDSDSVPTFYYNKEFRDLGKPYEKFEFKRGQSKRFLLIYKVPAKLDKNNFSLYYQNVTNDGKSKLIKIKLNLEDITKVETMATVKLGDEQTLEEPKGTSEDIRINDVEINDAFNYNYYTCYSNGKCNIESTNIKSKNDNKILKISLITSSLDNQDIVDFSLMYGKIKYEDSKGKSVELNLKNAVDRQYLGNVLYLEVPNAIVDSKSLDLVYTIRNKQYIFNLK